MRGNGLFVPLPLLLLFHSWLACYDLFSLWEGSASRCLAFLCHDFPPILVSLLPLSLVVCNLKKGGRWIFVRYEEAQREKEREYSVQFLFTLK